MYVCVYVRIKCLQFKFDVQIEYDLFLPAYKANHRIRLYAPADVRSVRYSSRLCITGLCILSFFARRN